MNKTVAFHTSVNYAVQAPSPFIDVHEDILGDLARFSNKNYTSDFDFHIDMSLMMKRTSDGHCTYLNLCYDGECECLWSDVNLRLKTDGSKAAFLSFVPTPLVLLTDSDGEQAVHIALEAYNVTSVEFADQMDVWRDALPDSFEGDLSSVSRLSAVRLFAVTDKVYLSYRVLRS